MHCALCGFFCYQLARIYTKAHHLEYAIERKDLAGFGIFTLTLSIATMAMGVVCLKNFGKGLKPYINEQHLARGLEGYYEMDTQD